MKKGYPLWGAVKCPTPYPPKYSIRKDIIDQATDDNDGRKKERKRWQVMNEKYGVVWSNISFQDCIWATKNKKKRLDEESRGKDYSFI